MFKVLIADDEIIEREYLKNIIIKHYDKFILVGEANNGIQAMNKSIEKTPDIVIMDINMPICNGLIAAKNIKDKLDNIIILNTAYADFEYARQAVNYKIDSYLLKPASEIEILTTIESCVINRNKDYKNALSLGSKVYLIDKEYPFSTIDKLTKAILNHDVYNIKINMASYIDFFESKVTEFADYKLYIINSLFSILITIKESVSKEIYSLFECDRYFYEMNKVTQMKEAINIIENVLKKIIIVFETDTRILFDIPEKIQRYIDEKFEQKINLEMLSDIFHYSPSYISRIFHRSKGITINNYINMVRVNNSISLIKKSSFTIKEIAIACGFINITHFNKVFKEVTGKTPTDVREGR